ncbi:hypothetical protein [Sphingobacterium mizutaii]|uniref:hypothetical protein n=1 Tax=Sphingobacterium mizutaii TaxID=1010 RepID=UPI0028A2314B|nr:hypothetical protein [Sphingobacterium mizutaii]
MSIKGFLLMICVLFTVAFGVVYLMGGFKVTAGCFVFASFISFFFGLAGATDLKVSKED